MRHMCRLGAARCVAGALVLAGVALASGALGQAADAPPSIVEDFSYPGAREILETKGIELISGDGNITLADCGSAQNLIKVETLTTPGTPGYCFNVDGDRGRLRLRLEKAFLVWAGDESLRAAVSVDGVEQPPVEIEAGKVKPVGASDPEDFAVLLELRAGAQ